ncbi:MAG: Cof-type HAD-IIB family hydrolase [Clostridiaceae bacterium]
MSKFKLVALDMDGTLTNDEKLITPKTKAALIEIQKQGAVVVLASGRPTTGLYEEAAELRLHEFGGYLLSYNGARISKAVDRAVIHEDRLPRHMIPGLVEHVSKFPVSMIFDDGVSLYTTNRDGYAVSVESRITHLDIVEITNLNKVYEVAPVKLLMSAEPSVLRGIEKEIGAPFPELEFVRSAPFFLEAVNKGVSKGAALKLLAESLGIKREEIMAFGDEHNDIPMLEYAGLGVGMENACDEILEMCDVVTLSNNNDGVAHILAMYFENI